MLVLDQIVQVRWNGNTMNHYIEKGYVFTRNNNFFDCKLEDVMTTSTAKVEVVCDYCGEPFYPTYRNYFKGRKIIEKDCCSNRKCMVEKSKEVHLKKYGVDNNTKRKEVREKLSEYFRTPFSEVLEECERKNITLLTSEKDYKNSDSKLEIICKNHPEYGIQDTCFSNIKANKGCCYYGRGDLVAKNRRLDGNIVYDAFIDNGFDPKFSPNDYINNNTPLPFICNNHIEKGIQHRRFGALKITDGCKYCSKERVAESLRHDENFIFNQLKEKGLIPVEGQKYFNKDYPIFYRCVNHSSEIQHTTYKSFTSSNQCCKFCRIENSLSNLNRWLRSCIDEWKQKSLQNCNYKCVLTGSSKDLEVHHLINFNDLIKEALTILNMEIKDEYSGTETILIRDKVNELHNKYPLGVCLQKNYHIRFHQIYGKTNNTEQEFEEFKIRYKFGEFEDALSQVSSL